MSGDPLPPPRKKEGRATGVGIPDIMRGALVEKQKKSSGLNGKKKFNKKGGKMVGEFRKTREKVQRLGPQGGGKKDGPGNGANFVGRPGCETKVQGRARVHFNREAQEPIRGDKTKKPPKAVGTEEKRSGGEKKKEIRLLVFREACE